MKRFTHLPYSRASPRLSAQPRLAPQGKRRWLATVRPRVRASDRGPGEFAPLHAQQAAQTRQLGPRTILPAARHERDLIDLDVVERYALGSARVLEVAEEHDAVAQAHGIQRAAVRHVGVERGGRDRGSVDDSG
eukprot:3440092-Prymnesium_polylepis.2